MEETKTTAAEAEVEATPVKEETEVVTDKADKKKTKKQDAEIAELKKMIEQKNADLSASEDKYLRMMAEYDNFRKRSAKELESRYADAYADCVANILPILDNLERASKSDNFEAVKKGLEMTAKAFEDALSKMGITEIEAKTFDPNLHNAVMHIEDETLGESEIVEVFQKGYTKGDKVIRYAMVKVAN